MGLETASAAGELATEPFVLADDFYQDPNASYDRLRARGPVNRVRFPDGSTGWLVTDYDAAKETFMDPTISKVLKSPGARTALASNGGGNHLANSMFADMLVFYDPPEHTRLRAVVNRAFATRAIKALEPRITEIADALLAEPATGDLDLLESYAIPLSMTSICELLGVPEQDRDNFRTWSTMLISSDHPNAVRMAAVQEFVGYLGRLIQAKTQAPEADMLSELIAVGADEDRLTQRELLSMVFMLLVAGFETTAHLIGNAVATLLADNNSRAALREDPSRIGDFIEEVLRYRSPTTETTFRYTTAPVTLGGIDIPAGELIIISVAATGRDAGRFAEPDTIDIDRTDNQHLAFGHGIHRCVGAPLARMGGVIGLARLLDRYPDFELAPGAETEWRKSFVIRGLTNLPVRLRP
ncbi:cytochrome P450 [Nocardia sp. SYP-A9097]|uniref:cytochrome P450 family protein n=1 Tax=Nocardia sp. SYP-A9097 TaxID=2663237 RepID=UPI00129C0327|nr:cytochrome P450 [Nocardia sp. SYP-A9097]MRH88080.1 cytochrome P450 [Nocardia sp. SYP-A9097]